MSQLTDTFPAFLLFPLPGVINLPLGLWKLEIYTGGDNYTATLPVIQAIGPLIFPITENIGPRAFVAATEVLE